MIFENNLNSTVNMDDLKITAILSKQIDALLKSKKKVFLISTANSVEKIDLALRRPGRFFAELEIPIPNKLERLEILECLIDTPEIDASEISPECLDKLSAKAHGFVGADLEHIIKEACLLSIDKSEIHKIKISDLILETAFVKTRPSCIREIQLEVPRVFWEDIGGQEDTKQKLRECVEWPLKVRKMYTLISDNLLVTIDG
jgi:AAA family ATPase